MPIHTILWTAGLDSTCRVVQLASQEGNIIQPYYIFDPGRRSSGIEIDRIRKMTELIRTNPATRSTLLDVKITNLSDIPRFEDIIEAGHILHSKYKLGRQYTWIASFARQEGIVAQISLENGEYGATYVLEQTCTLSDDGSTIRIVPSESTPAGRTIFENMAFPSRIWTLTKKDEIDEIRNLGYKEVFELTWFCHRPVLGRPCGHCVPCKSCINEGLGYRIPRLGRYLYPVAALYRAALGLPK